MRRRLLTLVVFIVCISAAFTTAGEAAAKSDCEGGKVTNITYKNSTFDTHLEYEFHFYEAPARYCLYVTNLGETKLPGSFTAMVDSKPTSIKAPSLSPGENMTVTKNITGYLDVRKDNHTVVLGAYQQEVTYNFTKKSSAENQTIPTPVISDVDVVRHEKNDSTSLRVSIFNPAKRGYGMYIQVETLGTDGEYTIAAPQENATSTVTIHLDESADDVVAGKVRIFGDWANSETKFDQKEFMAKPGQETKYWDVEFDRVPGTKDTQKYQNETARKAYQGYDEDLLSPIEKQAGAVGTVLVLMSLLWWLRRPS